MDNVIMRFMDVLLAFPSLLLAIAIVTILGPGLINALLAIGIVSIPAYAACNAFSSALHPGNGIRGSLTLHWVVARCISYSGVSLPNSMTPLIVQGTSGDRYCHPGRCRTVFLGVRCPTANARMGIHAECGTQSGVHCAIPGILPGTCHHVGRALV